MVGVVGVVGVVGPVAPIDASRPDPGPDTGRAAPASRAVVGIAVIPPVASRPPGDAGRRRAKVAVGGAGQGTRVGRVPGWVAEAARRLSHNGPAMRLVIAQCTVDYAGRLSAHLPLATRLIMVKADGSVSVHSDGGAYKPLNWMTPPCQLRMSPDCWVVANSKGETITIQMEEILWEVEHELGADPGLRKDGVEADLQELLAARPEAVAAGLSLIRREYPTDIGPVDLLCRDAEGRAVAIEIKRRGEIDGEEQLTRYLERLDLDGRLRPVRGIFVAQQIKPQAQVLAAARGIDCVEVDYDELRGAADDRLTLF